MKVDGWHPGLSENEKDALQQAFGSPRRLEPGQTLLREGGDIHAIHLVTSGWAYRYKIMASGQRQTISILKGGDICDLDGLFFKRVEYSITALTPCVVASLPVSAAINPATLPPYLMAGLWWLMAVENSMMAERLLSLGRRSASERLAHLFCEIISRSSLGDNVEGESVMMPLTQEQLADLLGLTPVHVNRVLQSLRSKELIALDRRQLVVFDWPRLKALAGFKESYLHPTRRLTREMDGETVDVARS